MLGRERRQKKRKLFSIIAFQDVHLGGGCRRVALKLCSWTVEVISTETRKGMPGKESVAVKTESIPTSARSTD